MPKILFTTSSFNLDHCRERVVIEQSNFELILNPHGRRLTEEDVLALLDDQVVGIVAGTEPLTESVMRKAPSLKVISRCGVGLDNVDLEAAKRYGIQVYNTPHAPTPAVAELTLGHILSLSRYMMASDRLMHAGTWKPMMGRLIAKQTVGIIGFGRIGRYVATLLEAFGARVLVYDKYPALPFGKVAFVALEELLEESDVITLHLPYDATTHHIINEHTLRLMKSTALLVNVARGGLIDEEALYAAMRDNQLAGVALDCFEDEPYTGPLLSCEHVQMTSHMGSYAHETRAIMEAEACDALVCGLREMGLLSGKVEVCHEE